MNLSTSHLLSQAGTYSNKPHCHISFTHVVVLFATTFFCQERQITGHGCHLLVMSRNTNMIKVFTSHMTPKLNTAVWRVQPNILHETVGS